MSEEEPTIQIRAATEKPVIEFRDATKELLERYDKLTYLIIAAILVGFIILILMAGTLILDAFHFNSAVYKEYSNKLNTRERSCNRLGSNSLIVSSELI